MKSRKKPVKAEQSRKKKFTEESESTSISDFSFRGAHIPVMLEECLDALAIDPDKTYVDATLGAGGHYLAVEKQLAGGSGRIIGLDRDYRCIEALKDLVVCPTNLIHSNNARLEEALNDIGIGTGTVNGGILADLGVSSMQLDNAERGFSFMQDAPLDMRMDSSQALTAEQLINTCEEDELSDIIFKYGEERHSRRIAHAIVGNRPIKTTLELADLVSKTLSRFQNRGTKRANKYGAGKRREKHPATRTFQAIRIAVNEELTSLEFFLDQAVRMMEPGARLAVITFHSLEDRIVKQFLKEKAVNCICPSWYPVCKCSKEAELRIVTRKPIVPSEEEVEANPRARSAKLRVAERIE
ncbi:MAG: 16S rRNA (cytosine(1402)-N(4))-methyltransferase RsmH [Cyanobacteriota/Melainabacteria group bacterium]